MADRKGMKDWSTEKVIERFERDIRYDAHSTLAKFDRSWAREELEARGKRALKPIASHLRANMPDGSFDLDWCWGVLLASIQNEIDPKKTGPSAYRETESWIKWAEKFA